MWWVLFPARKQEALTQGGTGGMYDPTWKRTQGAGIVKDWEDKLVRTSVIPYSHKTRITLGRDP